MAKYIRKFGVTVKGFKHDISKNVFLIAANYFRYKHDLLGTCFFPKIENVSDEILSIMKTIIQDKDSLVLSENKILDKPVYNAQRLELNGKVNVKRILRLELTTISDLNYHTCIHEFVESEDYKSWEKNNSEKVSRLDNTTVGEDSVRVAKQISIESALELSELLLKHKVYDFIECRMV